MAGHSKWKNIKHKKALEDGKKAKKFTKLLKEITICAKVSGGDLNSNPTLRSLISKANEINMPKDNYIRAIKRGTGEIAGEAYETSYYEGYGPGGISVIVEVLSDNKNRAISEIRRAFSHNGGNLAEVGCVTWMFEKKGLITANHENPNEDELFDKLLNYSVDDISINEKTINIVCDINDLNDVKNALIEYRCKIDESNVGYNPKETINLSDEDEEKAAIFLNMLEELDDVQNVYANI